MVDKMKFFKIMMKATSIKNIILIAENEEEALDKLDKLYFEDDKIEFTDNDIIEVDNVCEEIDFTSEYKDNFIEIQ